MTKYVARIVRALRAKQYLDPITGDTLEEDPREGVTNIHLAVTPAIRIQCTDEGFWSLQCATGTIDAPRYRETACGVVSRIGLDILMSALTNARKL